MIKIPYNPSLMNT